MKGLWVASIGAAVVAVVLLTRMAGYLVDVEQPQCSLEPHDKWRTAHSCLTAYAEAARFAAEAERNVYDPALYEGRFMSGLKVDTYHYPPPFLVVPDALQRATGGYLELRPVWFGLQLAALLAAVLLIARWLGGELQPRVLLGAPQFFHSLTTLFTLQMGIFQSTAFALSLLGMIGLVSTRAGAQALGALAFAFAALSKVFPGVLGIYLIVTRRWRALAWIAGALSGLLGGLVGNQGGIRSAALLGVDLPKHAFVTTATAVALMVDAARVPVYGWFMGDAMADAVGWMAIATIGVVVGTMIGLRLLAATPERAFRRVVAIVLAGLGTAMLIRGLTVG